MKNSHYLFLLPLFWVIVLPTFAQSSFTLQGIVTDQATGAVLRGVNVAVENTFYGTVTDISGKFFISMTGTPTPVLQFSREGYHALNLPGKANESVTIVMKPLSAAASQEAAAVAQVSEYRLKLNFVKQFIGMTTWKNAERRDKPFVVGIIGYNYFGDDLFAFEKTQIEGREVQVKFLAAPAEIGEQDVLIISRKYKQSAAELNAALEGKSILSICDQADNCNGILSFVAEGTKLRFSVNEEMAKKASILLAPTLLQLAVKP